MNTKKGYKYYTIVFFSSVGALAAYIIYLSIKEGSIDYDLIYYYAPVPFVFTAILFAFDKLMELIFPGQSKKADDKYKKYLERIGVVIEEQCDFTLEGYRKLRENARFQKSIEQVFRILNNGETEEISFQFLEKKFKKNTDEYKALQAVIEEVKKMMVN